MRLDDIKWDGVDNTHWDRCTLPNGKRFYKAISPAAKAQCEYFYVKSDTPQVLVCLDTVEATCLLISLADEGWAK